MPTKEQITCPLCRELIVHEVINGVHAWICGTCPFIGFEFWEKQDAKSLAKYLTSNK